MTGGMARSMPLQHKNTGDVKKDVVGDRDNDYHSGGEGNRWDDGVDDGGGGDNHDGGDN